MLFYDSYGVFFLAMIPPEEWWHAQRSIYIGVLSLAMHLLIAVKVASLGFSIVQLAFLFEKGKYLRGSLC